MELLVSIRRDIDLTPQLGKHKYSVFLRRPPRGPDDPRLAVIKPARYQTSDQIVGMGEGWKSGARKLFHSLLDILPDQIIVSYLPFVEVPLIRKHKFVDPYPSPGLPPTPQDTKLAIVRNEDSKDMKFRVKNEEADFKPEKIKQGIEVGVAMRIESVTDVKPVSAKPSVRITPTVKIEKSFAPSKREPGRSQSSGFSPVWSWYSLQVRKDRFVRILRQKKLKKQG
jgi:hypothetical protein